MLTKTTQAVEAQQSNHVSYSQVHTTKTTTVHKTTSQTQQVETQNMQIGQR